MSFYFMEAVMSTNEVSHSFQLGNRPSFPVVCVESRPYSWFWLLLYVFQRLVEAAEEAHLKHEFDADLQVTDFTLS